LPPRRTTNETVGRIGGPQVPEGSLLGWSGHGIYVHGQDFVPPDPDSHGGGNLRDGVDPNDPGKTR
jgi:hypothetical protein